MRSYGNGVPSFAFCGIAPLERRTGGETQKQSGFAAGYPGGATKKTSTFRGSQPSGRSMPLIGDEVRAICTALDFSALILELLQITWSSKNCSLIIGARKSLAEQRRNASHAR